ncbi:MAG: AAA family ATPase [Nitrosopumilus sp.]|nr:AAA family ATPase [Nitrosopumilus sp.]
MPERLASDFQLNEISEISQIPIKSLKLLQLSYDQAYDILSDIKYHPVAVYSVDAVIKGLRQRVLEKEFENEKRMQADITNTDPSLTIVPDLDENISNNEISKAIPELVKLGLEQPGKTIKDINHYLLNVGDKEQLMYADLPIWHQKKEIDKFVQNKLNLTNKQIADLKYPSGKNKFYQDVVSAISKLREKEVITDWQKIDDGRTGVWRLTDTVIQDIKQDNQHFSKNILTNNGNTDFFMITGPWTNWEFSIHNMPMKWGIKPEALNNTIYKMMKPGDIVFFYQTLYKPIHFSKRGVFGVGKVIAKKDSTGPFWPDEVKEGKILYEKIFEIERIKIAQNDDEVIPWIEGLPWTKGLNHIVNENSLSKLLDDVSKKWGIVEFQTHVNTESIPLSERDSKSLELPEQKKLDGIIEKIKEKLLVDKEIIEKIIASLYSGKHILLTGPVGTGKTDLAQTIPKMVWNYFPEIHTATADWTTQDVIGGLFPKIEKNDQMKFKIQLGCVSSTIAKNWSDKTGQNGDRVTCTKTDSNGQEYEYEGVWLVIDEFNRANIDRAFGQLFTALEYRNELKVPTEKIADENEGEEFDRFIIPSDYRIIGTLNTYDKHFLFHLSDALKRRFDFIEVTVPQREDYEKEFDIAIQKAADKDLLKLEVEKLLNESRKTKLHLIEIFAFIRKIKPLGTAILISILRDLLIYHKMGKDWDESLDSGFVKKVIPQLEGVPSTLLKMLYKFVEGKLGDFFIQFPIDEYPEKINDYKEALENYEKYYVEYSKKKFSQDWKSQFVKGELNKLQNDETLNETQKNQREQIKVELNPWGEEVPNLKNFKKSLASLVKENELSTIGNIESDFE